MKSVRNIAWVLFYFFFLLLLLSNADGWSIDVFRIPTYKWVNRFSIISVNYVWVYQSIVIQMSSFRVIIFSRINNFLLRLERSWSTINDKIKTRDFRRLIWATREDLIYFVMFENGWQSQKLVRDFFSLFPPSIDLFF